MNSSKPVSTSRAEFERVALNGQPPAIETGSWRDRRHWAFAAAGCLSGDGS